MEVSTGTGRNVSAYPDVSQLESVTFLDASRKMLEKTVETFNRHQLHFQKTVDPNPATNMLESMGKTFRKILFGGPRNLQKQEIPVDFYKMNIANMDFPDNSFDTVVQTFGLCSVGTAHGPDPGAFGGADMSDATEHGNAHSNSDSDSHFYSHDHPVEALNEMARVCKPDGTVLLLERGKSSYTLMNDKLLDPVSVSHFHKWGCWVNRDIEKLVRQSNLEIIYHRRWHFGTTHYIIAKPKAECKQNPDGAAAGNQGVVGE